MRYWQAVVLGLGCFLLSFWYSPSIAYSDEGQVLILNAATEPIKMANSKCAVRNFHLEKLSRGERRPFGTK